MQTYRANLTAAEFPMISEFQGRNVIVGGNDQNFNRHTNSPKNKDRDIGIPQIYYMHNVIGTDAGVTSVGYLQQASTPFDTDNTFNEAFVLRDPAGNVAILATTTSGRNYVLPSIGGGWLRTTDKAPAAGKEVTTAYVNGETYIYYGGNNCFKYDFATNALVAVTLMGLTPASILGVCASSGYMIAWTTNKVFWSSTINPEDFLPSLATGAGSQSLQQARGELVSCLPHNSGFVVYTKKNAVGASYTGNAQYPFTFKNIDGCGGLSASNLVSFDGNSTNHFAYTTSGLQEISMQNSVVLFPQVTDFIAGSQFEDFDEVTKQFTVTPLSSPMLKKLTMVSNRYLVISYGIAALTHALVYDFALARWGKLKVPHVDCFEFIYPSTAVIETPRRSIAFLQLDGTVKVATMSYDTSGSYGVVVLGKYQYDRNRYLAMHEIHLESIREGSVIEVKWLTTLDGKTAAIAPTVLAASSGTYRRYNCYTSGLNHSLVVVGAFHLHSLELAFTDEGAVS